MPTFDFPIELAPREWARQFANVVSSFAKTVTEAVTNSDSSYKRKFHLPDSSGLVTEILNCAKGTRLDSAALRAKLSEKPKREIQIHLYTAKGYERPPRSCDIVDSAEGLSLSDVEAAFRQFAADKSAVSKGRPGRSLFGRGISDVLFGHKEGELFSYKDNVLTSAKFEFDSKVGKPRVTGSTIQNPTKRQLSDVHLKSGENGTCVRFLLSDDCSIPDEGRAIPLLSRFYMLRLINSDPGVGVRVFRYRAAGVVYDDVLDYDFPVGDVIGKFGMDLNIPEELTKKKFLPLRIDGIVCRADLESPLKGREARDERENGLLLVDDKDAVLDLTFLPDFDGAPYLNKIFGVVRLSGIRSILEHYLNQGKESPLTTTRDGFYLRHEFTQFLFGQLRKQLEPIYRKEEERHKKSESQDLSKAATQRLNDAMRQLNKYLNDLLGSGEDGTGDAIESKDVPIQFVPAKTKVVVGQPRFVTLLIRTADAKPKGTIMFDSSNPKIEVSPTSLTVEKGVAFKQFLAYRICLRSDTLHESALITVLADGKDGTLDSQLDVTDVVGAPMVEPPLEMEFRPAESVGQPNKKHYAVLYVNLAAVPLGRRIEVSIVKSQGAIGLLDENGKRAESVTVQLEKKHQIPDSTVARLPIAWSGSGWGQFARIMAETKIPAGKVVTAVATLTLDQEDEGGLIKDIKYRSLGNQKCSDLVDGVIYINSDHTLNRAVFGTTQEDYAKKMDTDRTAQYRVCTVITEQSVYRLAEDLVFKNKLLLVPTAPVTSMREFVDAKTNEFAPKLLKILVTAD
ncbi:MAG: hypothetical protein WB952_20255 [Terriglobales bacterium]